MLLFLCLSIADAIEYDGDVFGCARFGTLDFSTGGCEKRSSFVCEANAALSFGAVDLLPLLLSLFRGLNFFNVGIFVVVITPINRRCDYVPVVQPSITHYYTQLQNHALSDADDATRRRLRASRFCTTSEILPL